MQRFFFSVFFFLSLVALVLTGCATSTANAPTAAPTPSTVPSPVAQASPPASTATAEPSPAAATATVAPGPSATTAPTAAPTTAASATAQPASTSYPLTIQDDHKRSVTLAQRPERIVSIAPSCTEILYAVGAGDRVVGVDGFSDYPPEVKSKPKVGSTKTNIEQILALRPDLVCAAGITPADDIKALEQAKVTVLVLDGQSISGVLGDITLAGQVVGNAAAGKQVADKVQSRIQAVQEKVAGAPRPRVFDELDATDPSKPYTVGPGSFVDGLITAAGGQNAFAGATSAYPQVNLEEILHVDPQIILLSDAPYGNTPDAVAKRTGWSGLTAVKQHAIYPVEDDIMSRPGPRIADAVETLAKIFHPERFK